jgi:hypothetical protein
MLNKKAMGMHWYILIISFFISVGVIIYYEFIDSPIPKVGEYSTIMSNTLEKSSIIPSLIERVMEDINKQSTVRFNDHIEFLDLLDSYCDEDYKDNLGWSGFLIPREADIEIPEEERGQSTYCHMDTIRAKNKFRIIFTNRYNYFVNPLNTDFTEDFNLAGLQYDFTNPSEESGEFFIKMTVRDASQGLRFQINKEDGSMLGSYRMRPGFKLLVDHEFNNFDDPSTPPDEMCLFVAGCANFTDVLTRYPQLEDSPYYYKIREEPCEYYSYLGSVCTAADIADATDNFGKYYETGRFLCRGDCIPPPCSLDNEALTQYRFPTGCRAEDCGSYYSCFKTDCTCSSDDLKACVGRTDPSTRAFCKPYCSYYYKKTEDGDPLTNCRMPCDKFYYCNDPGDSTTIRPIDACFCPGNRKCVGRCIRSCEATAGKTPDRDADTNCQDNPCGSYVEGTCSSTLDCGCENSHACAGDCTPYCDLDVSSTTNCQDNPCGSYVEGTCDPILSDCACLTGNACMGDCDVCTYDPWEDVGGCGDGTCAADGVPQEKESTNGCATETRCRHDPSCP